MAKVDDEFILANFGTMSQRQIAEHLGVSASTVNRHVMRLGLKGDSPGRRKDGAGIKVIDFSAEAAVRDESRGDLARLKELRGILMNEIKATEGPGVAKLSKEYREVLKDIATMEGGADDGLGEFEDIASRLRSGMPAADVASG